MATGRHRDAFSAWELHEYYTMLVNPFANNQYAQNKGTDVLIFSMGNAEMEMGLSFPIAHPINWGPSVRSTRPPKGTPLTP